MYGNNAQIPDSKVFHAEEIVSAMTLSWYRVTTKSLLLKHSEKGLGF